MQNFTIPNMTCGHCSRTITQAMKELDPNCELEFDMKDHRLQVASSSDRDKIVQALSAAGYTPA